MHHVFLIHPSICSVTVLSAELCISTLCCNGLTSSCHLWLASFLTALFEFLRWLTSASFLLRRSPPTSVRIFPLFPCSLVDLCFSPLPLPVRGYLFFTDLSCSLYGHTHTHTMHTHGQPTTIHTHIPTLTLIHIQRAKPVYSDTPVRIPSMY